MGVLSTQSINRPEVKIAVCAVLVMSIAFFKQSAATHPPPVSDLESERVAVAKSVKMASGASVGTPEMKVPPRSQAAVSATPKAAIASTTQIARVGEISLLVPNLDKAVQAAAVVIQRQSGDLISLDDQNPEESRFHRTAQMEIRVSESRFDATMTALSQVGKARARSISAEDLSSQIVDSAARLRNLRRTESDISKIMDRAGSIGQVLDAENQLSYVRERIETLEAELKTMRTRVRYSTIKVTMEAEAASPVVATSGATQLADAWHSALHAVWQLTLGLAATLMWIAVFVPYVIAATLFLSLLNLQLRKRRGSA
ncbi:MAG: DUF4349 domain-containing protein [Candidatus Eremiobacteraeota bacterium]|nr:DUF4349 domain-containing protein [Candidatus Eremiobacteraeota bacterium]